eukprot:NODE_1417_length_965_cov_109.228166_g1094_i0.p1 GENE.NODE_1417_length_965_cov_109.228166_g1094_i0~~NODE_1417_length_965_cov_109.228166_g1094_i0.p1  ORF type:complete len:202 (+),score=43.72 NODE_1417_length_965_cov_109.228166_g1094_i0:64-606(+)
MQDSQKVAADLRRVEEVIDVVEKKLDGTIPFGQYDTVDRLWQKEHDLRQKEHHLRQKEHDLRQKEHDLRQEKLALLQPPQDQFKTDWWYSSWLKTYGVNSPKEQLELYAATVGGCGAGIFCCQRQYWLAQYARAKLDGVCHVFVPPMVRKNCAQNVVVTNPVAAVCFCMEQRMTLLRSIK